MTYNTIFKIYISIFISVIVTIIAISGITFLGDNWIIPDTYHLFNTAKYDTTFSLSDIYSQHKTSVLFLFINKVLYSIGLYSFCIANTAMIIYAFFKHHEDRRFCFVFLVLSPLFFINIPLPSKDIMVTFLFCIWVYAVYSEASLTKTILLSLIILLVRDGFGIILIATSIILKQKIIYKAPILLIIIATLIASLISDVLPNYANDFFLFQRVIDIANEYNSSSYILRIFGNVTNFSSRNPLITDKSTLNITFMCYTITGVTILSTFLLSIKAIRSNYKSDVRISFCYFLITIAFSISPLIQARYMAPLILMPTFYKCISKKDVFICHMASIFISIILSLLYVYLGVYPEKAPVENFTIN